MDILKTHQEFIDLLIESNERVNLFSRKTTKEELIEKHLFDSLTLNDHIKLKGSVLDVGCGGGLPSLPLAISNKDTSFTLLDSVAKKLNEIAGIAEKLELTNVTVLNGRAEELAHDKKYRETFDFVIARAVAALPTLLEITIPFLKKGGTFIAYKGSNYEEELSEAKNAMNKLGITVQKIINYEIPLNGEKRCYVIFKKHTHTKNTYPRQVGTPKKNPL